jgi:uncharacterized protein YlaN (UPF0358 family)
MFFLANRIEYGKLILYEICFGKEGTVLTVVSALEYQQKAIQLLQADADKILRLIEVQMKNLTMPQCPLYEEVLDTQMFGLSREIDFAVRLHLIQEDTGKRIMQELERRLSELDDLHENERITK